MHELGGGWGNAVEFEIILIYLNKIKMETPKEINLEKYAKLPESEIYLDPRPRIKNIVRELEEEHGWTWPPQPHKDFEKSRQMKRRKWSCLYSKECLDISSILALIIGPWEILVALGFSILPKTFVPALRESSEFCIIFVALFFFQGFKHTFVALLGLGLRSMHPYLIGFVHVSWPYETVWPLLGIFVSAVGFYTTQAWRVKGEMTLHLKGYTGHWFSRAGWDRYQGFMRCCGIKSWKDWSNIGPSLLLDGKLATVPKSCCVGETNCAHNAKDDNIHSWGCLQITTMSLDVIFVSGTICMGIGFLLGIIGYRSLREAQDCVGDPIHTLLFESTSGSKGEAEGGPTGIESRSLRRQELLSLLDHYCLQLGSEMGLKEEVKKARQQLGLNATTQMEESSPTPTSFGRIDDTRGPRPSDAVTSTQPREEETGKEDPKKKQAVDALDSVSRIPKLRKMHGIPEVHPIPPQPLRLAPKLMTSRMEDAEKVVLEDISTTISQPLLIPATIDEMTLLENCNYLPMEEEKPGPSRGGSEMATETDVDKLKAKNKEGQSDTEDELNEPKSDTQKESNQPKSEAQSELDEPKSDAEDVLTEPKTLTEKNSEHKLEAEENENVDNNSH